MIAIGMDTHKELSYVYASASDPSDVDDVIFAEEFNTEFRRPVTSDAKGLGQISSYLEGREHCILIENSSKAHDVFWTLTDLGCTVLVANASDLYRINMSILYSACRQRFGSIQNKHVREEDGCPRCIGTRSIYAPPHQR